MPAYYTRVQFLYKKLGELNAGVSKSFHLYHLTVTLLKAYPERSLFWLRGLRNKTLDLKSLERDLEEISSSEETTAMFNKIVASKDTENNCYHPGCLAEQEKKKKWAIEAKKDEEEVGH
ncbi:hypothetical protein B0T24DRAFT_666866 [Lasiosphaeria ovina]|uniref:Uncharacterized protein n=1 Tax=Lasiosphaeria ovina TaxID=92902 RepID=A0AAE0N7J7_9PEZI|nr:hypothetical protein B0T24DRAFT_666866 [Lasiosphaeria ovina]